MFKRELKRRLSSWKSLLIDILAVIGLTLLLAGIVFPAIVQAKRELLPDRESAFPASCAVTGVENKL
jgi:hypothetical protein